MSRNRGFSFLFYLTVCLLCLPVGAYAQSAAATTVSQDLVPPLRTASFLIQEGQPQAACTLLQRMSVPSSQEAQRLYLFSHCLRDMNRLPEAIRAMEQVVVLTPQLATPRLELAELNIRLNRMGPAQDQLVNAARLNQQSELDPELRSLVERLSSNDPAALARARTRAKPWEVELFAGLVYDTNINGGPSSDLIPATVGNISGTIRLDPEALPKEAWGAMTSMAGSYRQPLGVRTSLLIQAGVNRTDYFGESRYRNDGLSLAAAWIYQGGDYSFSLQPSFRYLRQKDQLQEAQHGVTARFTKAMGRNWNLTAAVEYTDRRIPQDHGRNADAVSASVGGDVLLAPNFKVGANYTLLRESARQDIYSRRASGPSVYALWQVRNDLQLIANYRYQRTHYDQKPVFFPQARKDQQHMASLTALWDVSRYTGHDMSVRLQYLYANNHSNIGLYDYDRQVLMGGLQFRF